MIRQRTRWRAVVLLAASALFAFAWFANAGAPGKVVSLDAAPVHSTEFHFADQDWALPEGAWEVLAYIPKLSPIGGGHSFRAALARFDANRQLVALLLYSIGEVGDRPGSSAANSPTCTAPLPPFQAERQIVDENSTFDCWMVGFVDPRTWGDDAIYNAIRQKLKATPASFPEFATVLSVRKRYGIIASTQVLFDLAHMRPILSATTSGPATHGPTEGTRHAILQLSREWAIRWQGLFSRGFSGRPDLAAPLPLPVLGNPRGDIPMIPDMGLKAGETFHDAVPIGPFLFPLPKGAWTVLLRNPKLDAVGSVRIDQVTLVNVENGRLDGMINLDSRTIVTPSGQSASPSPCEQYRALLVYREEPDEYCAQPNWVHIFRDDPAFPVFQELRQQGVEAPSGLIGSLFSFSNKLINIRAFVMFSPDHVGLPDVASDDIGHVPPEWTRFNLKWRQWTRDWGDVIEAGFTGRTEAGPLPEGWRDIDLKSEPPPRSPAPKLGDIYAGTVSVGGRDWPLPPGDWTVAAVVPQTKGTDIVADQIYLVDLKPDGVAGIVSFASLRPDIPPMVRSVIRACSDPPDDFHQRPRFDPGMRQDCWSVEVRPTARTRGDMHGFEALEAELRSRGLTIPDPLLLAMFDIVDRDREVLATYAFPAAQVAPGPTRDIDAVRDWARSWHDVFRLGFDGGLKPGPLPEPWADLSPETVVR